MSEEIFKEGGPHGLRPIGPDLYKMRIEIPPDSDGMIGRECPDAICSPGYFKVRIGTGVTEGQTSAYCPYCRHESSPDDFLTRSQRDYAVGQLESEAIKGIDQMIEKSLGLGSSRRKKIDAGMMSIELSYTPSKPMPVSRPIEEELRRDLTCCHCGLDHAVFGLAVWCPDCGTDIFLYHVEAELAVVRKILTAVETRREELGARVAARDIENALEDVVSIFETILKVVTRRHMRTSGVPPEQIAHRIESVIRNSYQNIASAADTFRTHVGMELFEGVSEDELTHLRLAFEKRHPITHNLGIVDRKYLDRVRSGELEGREIRTSAQEVLRAIEISNSVIRRAYERLFLSERSQISGEDAAE
jgi:predicted  nucleic acid-binding Zn-ribbon protein